MIKADNLTLVTLIGALIGLLVYKVAPESYWIAGFVSLAGFLFFPMFGEGGDDAKAPAFFAAALSGFITLCGWLSTDTSLDSRLFMEVGGMTKPLYALFLVIILCPFFLAYAVKGKLNADYPLLGKFAWEKPFVVFSGYAFIGLVWLILFIWIFLFKAIGVGIFETVFLNGYFISASVGGAYALGVAISNKNGGFSASRRIRENLCSIVTPVLALLSVLFLSFLPLTGLDVVWESGHTAMLVAGVIVLAITAINAVIGDEKPVESRLLGLSARVLSLALPLLALLALWALVIRIEAYGIMPRRIDAFILLMVAVLYALTYGYAVTRHWKGDWVDAIRRINITNSLIVASVCAVMLLPICDFEKISASQQKNLLLSGKIDADAFDYGALKFKLGRAGLEALADIKAAAPKHKDGARITAQLTRLDKTDYYYSWERGGANAASPINKAALDTRFTVYPKGQSVPEDFISFMDTGSQRYEFQQCIEGKSDKADCILYFMDVVGDTAPEILYVSRNSYRPDLYYKKADGQWGWYDLTVRSGKTSSLLTVAIRNAAEAGQVSAVPADYKMIKAGDEILQFNPTELR